MVEGLTVARARRTVVHDVSFEVGAGTTVLVGPNGAGKSTTMAVLATLLAPRRGRVRLAGYDISTAGGRRAARARFGFLAQDASFPDRWSVVDAVTYAAWVHRVASPRRAEAVGACLRRLGLESFRDESLRRLSGGTRQRVMLAQALVHDPPVLLLDEPTVGLDAEHRVALRRTVRDLAVDRAVLLTTHVTEDVEMLADRVVAMSAGRVTFDGPPAAVAELGCDAPADERQIELGLRRLSRVDAPRDPP